jgi:3-methyl-2-oxobutanoate hydroxymethyltransferase
MLARKLAARCQRVQAENEQQRREQKERDKTLVGQHACGRSRVLAARDIASLDRQKRLSVTYETYISGSCKSRGEDAKMSTIGTPPKSAPVKSALATPAGSGPVIEKAEHKREKRTIVEIRESKRTGEKMVYMSVPDYTSAQWAEMAGVDVAVLGDSLAMIAHGHRNTVPATMDMMIMHGQAVRRGAPNTFVLGCMPYQSYNTVDRALVNATRFMQESLCDAVKPQGGKSQAHILRALVDAGIPTASHIGLTPHTIAMFGGFKIQGRTAEAAMKILEDALAIEDAGCFMLEFEAVPAKIAQLISEQLTIPTIGIGAGAGCDGQILLCYDLLGVFTDFKPKFTKRYAKLTEVAVNGIRQYVKEVKEGAFPDDEHSYTVNDAEYEKFAAMVAKRRQI